MITTSMHDFVSLHVPRVLAIEPLAGDASNKMYYRVSSSAQSYVLCYDSVFSEHGQGTYPFIQIHRLLKRAGVDVPEVYHTDQAHGLLLIEDLGDEMLEDAVESFDDASTLRVYRTIIDTLISIQSVKGSGPVFDQYFDTEKLLFEFSFFIDHTLTGYFKAPLSGHERELLEHEFHSIAGILDRPELSVFTHRDFHSRNIVVKDRKYYIIDFQDARMGLPQYDLVSLLRDSYTVLAPPVCDSLKDYYFRAAQDAGIHAMDRDTFDYYFDMQAFQRNIKALGTFGYQCTVKGNKKFERYIEATLSYLNDYVNRRPELHGAAEILNKYMPIL